MPYQRNFPAIPANLIYFGQPSGGFFFCNDFLTASCHGPFSLRRSGLGPGVDRGFAVALRFALVFFIGFIISNSMAKETERSSLSNAEIKPKKHSDDKHTGKNVPDERPKEKELPLPKRMMAFDAMPDELQERKVKKQADKEKP
jgi:hypothetical protein